MLNQEKAFYENECSAKKVAICCFLFSSGSAGVFLLLLFIWNEGGIPKIIVLGLLSFSFISSLYFSIHLLHSSGRFRVVITRTHFVMESPSPLFGETRTISIPDIIDIQEEYHEEVGYDYYLVMKNGDRIDISQFMTDSSAIMRTLKAINPEIRILQTGDRRGIPRFLRRLFRSPKKNNTRTITRDKNEPT
jgi:hypothetical protein